MTDQTTRCRPLRLALTALLLTAIAPDAGATLASMRSKQALRDMINPDWQLTAEERELKNNPIVGESVTDITMQANSGGLANLFRVKNQ